MESPACSPPWPTPSLCSKEPETWSCAGRPTFCSHRLPTLQTGGLPSALPKSRCPCQTRSASMMRPVRSFKASVRPLEAAVEAPRPRRKGCRSSHPAVPGRGCCCTSCERQPSPYSSLGWSNALSVASVPRGAVHAETTLPCRAISTALAALFLCVPG